MRLRRRAKQDRGVRGLFAVPEVWHVFRNFRLGEATRHASWVLLLLVGTTPTTSIAKSSKTFRKAYGAVCIELVASEFKK